MKKILERRAAVIGPACTVFYKEEPLHVVRGQRQYLYDEMDRCHLDCISNVQHVGHCHPVVVDAVHQQMLKSNCNTRFLDDNLVECAERICATLPAPLASCFFCNSGSEANDLALRIARDYTEGTEIIVLDHAYHGHLTSTIDISPYKFQGPGGKGKPDFVHIAPTPDAYRGKHRLPQKELGLEQAQRAVATRYVEDVRRILENIRLSGKRLCAFFMEALQSCGGQVITPPDYLRQIISLVHEYGGVVVVDEVQTGFGRVGDTFWAFQMQGSDLCPDVVTMGKPMGNGFPVAAVVTTGQIATRFGNGMQYFNTFGGNPVACAAALAVLRVLGEEQLQKQAREVGAALLAGLRRLADSHLCIGDVRGAGLFLGVDLVNDRGSREPATELASAVILHLRRHHRILVSAEGPFGNILKFKPPLCFTKENAAQVVDALDGALLICKSIYPSKI